jgi:hypothetical protein
MVKVVVALLALTLTVWAQGALIAGKWSGNASEQISYGKVQHGLVLQLATNGTAVTGTLTINTKTYALENGQYKDGSLSFSLKTSESVVTGALTYNGSAGSEHLKGKLTTDKGVSRDVDVKR